VADCDRITRKQELGLARARAQPSISGLATVWAAARVRISSRSGMTHRSPLTCSRRTISAGSRWPRAYPRKNNGFLTYDNLFYPGGSTLR
jgi:hypothetical protein